jgi:hypothetical protein
MTASKGKRTALWAAILTLIVAIVLPAAALANQPQGRGRGRGKDKISKQEKKNAKFKNGHDARDGRWDGRGPQRDDDWDDDDDWDRRRGGRDRDRETDGISDRNEIRDRALRFGYNEGYRAGRNDRASGRSFDYDDHSAYRDATAGYRSGYGDVDFYRSNFREGFRRGYEDGYRNRNSSGGRWGDILGDILGRP